jgi:hypothetical protein
MPERPSGQGFTIQPDNMKYSKIYNFKEMNSYQYIAVVGIVMSLAAHVFLLIDHKDIQNFWALYVCWTLLFIIGSFINLNSKPGEGHHHHHHH